ncbi:hypothetical protein [Alteribacillus sp. HJP-4]|uniref:hypothetical protein n=1 Tax=Alteribacillus sp. HJP-4 TaxID=2775394 RepID=UPI0035CCE72C
MSRKIIIAVIIFNVFFGCSMWANEYVKNKRAEQFYSYSPLRPLSEQEPEKIEFKPREYVKIKSLSG